MRIDLLYFDDCPSWQAGLQNLKTALAGEGIGAEVRRIPVEDPEQAARLRFLGSPSFQINGADLWPEDRQHYSLSCRVYATPAGIQGTPDVEMLRRKLREYASDL